MNCLSINEHQASLNRDECGAAARSPHSHNELEGYHEVSGRGVLWSSEIAYCTETHLCR